MLLTVLVHHWTPFFRAILERWVLQVVVLSLTDNISNTAFVTSGGKLRIAKLFV